MTSIQIDKQVFSGTATLHGDPDMPRLTRSALLNYSVAALVAVPALLLTQLLWPLIAPNAFPFFLAAVMLSSWYGGLGPGLLTTALSTLIVSYYFTPLHYSVPTSLEDIARPGLFAFVGILITALNEARRRAVERFGARALQQKAISELGKRALSSRNLSLLYDETVASVTQTLQVECCGIFELLPESGALLLRAGAGWKSGVVGQSTFPSKQTSPDYDVLSNEPVIIDNLLAGEGSKESHLLYKEGIISGLSLKVDERESQVKILGAFSTRLKVFTNDEIDFLRSVAEILAGAIERRRLEEDLQREKDFFERLINNSSDGFFAFDRNCRYIAWNSAMERISGISRVDALGKSAFDLFPFLKETGEDRYFFDALQGKSGISIDRPYNMLKKEDESLFEAHYSPLRDGNGEIVGGLAILYDVTDRIKVEEERAKLFREQAALFEAEAAERRSALLAEVDSVLAASADYYATLTGIACIAVNEIADWCIFDLVEKEGAFRRLVVAHANPSRAGMSIEVERLYSLDLPTDSNTLYGPILSLRTGRSELIPDLSDSWLCQAAKDASHLKNLQQLGLRSHISVPLLVRGETRGALTLISAESGRQYGPIDLRQAENIAWHCALAIDNARLQQELQSANHFRERFLAAISQESPAPQASMTSESKAESTKSAVDDRWSVVGDR
jgi:PAS domain S-box-containing protein